MEIASCFLLLAENLEKCYSIANTTKLGSGALSGKMLELGLLKMSMGGG